MSLKKDVYKDINLLWSVVGSFDDNIISLRKDVGLLQEQVVQLMRDQHQNDINVCGWKHQITDLKQEVCGLKTGHKFEYKGDVGPQHMFICKLCSYLVLKIENQLTPIERKALQTLGILNEPKKCSDR